MPSGRKPKPTALRLLNGMAGRSRPLNKDEPKVDPGAPEPPEHLSPEAREEWEYMCQRLVDAGIMTLIDRAVLAAYCQSYGRWQVAERLIRDIAERGGQWNGLLMKSAKGNPMINPLVGVANVAMRETVRYAVELGMTPSARSRIKATDAVAESDNPFMVLKHG